ncbi:hypothetical protein NT05LM_1472 [Listeria marthii FSL S4-120]|uniref:Uncharacterized protein n=1 Tax=Listeria marthii FSL S4-120 TaxID=702457 RepID=A0ABN0BXZ9_9LIST|nr:hypothetical protein NT05LM_1472 [Listeria marthii FSL S4-120]
MLLEILQGMSYCIALIGLSFMGSFKETKIIANKNITA